MAPFPPSRPFHPPSEPFQPAPLDAKALAGVEAVLGRFPYRFNHVPAGGHAPEETVQVTVKLSFARTVGAP